MPTRNIDQIFDLTKNALIAHGAAQWQADEVAKATAHSEAYGNVICGLQYVESYCIQLASGRVDGRADPIVTKPRASAVCPTHIGVCTTCIRQGVGNRL